MRKKFIPPRMSGSNGLSSNHSNENTTAKKSIDTPRIQDLPTITESLKENIGHSIINNKTSNQKSSTCKLKKKRTFTTAFLTPESVTIDKDADETSQKACQYFSCMWTVVSKKKHKVFQDGFFIVEEKRFLLLDDKGKVIAKDFTGSLKTCRAGEMYIIQNKEVELMEEILPNDYISGRCFLNQAPTSLSGAIKKLPSSIKSPYMPSTKQLPEIQKEIKSAPEGCFLLNPNHPMKDKNGDPIFDVWIDRFLSRVLHPHQVEGVRFMFECACGLRDFNGNGGILADEMGLGKTLQAITLFYTLLQRGINGLPVIKKAVIVTNSSLVDNWKKEVKVWLGDARCKPLVVSSKNANNNPEDTIKSFALSKVHSLLIISYGLAMKFATSINKANPGLLICDEGHKLKNSEIKVVKSLKQITTPRKFILTGTPVQNNLQEFYSIIDFINPCVFGSDSSRFKHLFEVPIGRAREPDASDQEKSIGLARSKELNRIVSQFMLRRTSDIIRKHLPPKTEMVVFCKMADQQREIYQNLLKSSYVYTLFSTEDRSNALAYIQMLRKLLAHPSMLLRDEADVEDDEEVEKIGLGLDSLEADLSMFKNREVVDVLHSGKLNLLVAMLKRMHAIGDNVVVVSYFTSILDLIQGVLENLGLTYCRMDGKTTQSRRMEIVDQFNSKHNQSFCFLLSSKTGGAGHNLIGANRLIIFDCDWNPANDAQAMARIWRHGQKKNVFIYRFIACGTVEEKIFQRQLVKTGLSKMAIDEKHSRSAFSREFLKELFHFTDDEYCETFEAEFESSDFNSLLKKRDELLYEAGIETNALTFVKVSCDNDGGSVLKIESVVDEINESNNMDYINDTKGDVYPPGQDLTINQHEELEQMYMSKDCVIKISPDEKMYLQKEKPQKRRKLSQE